MFIISVSKVFGFVTGELESVQWWMFRYIQYFATSKIAVVDTGCIYIITGWVGFVCCA